MGNQVASGHGASGIQVEEATGRRPNDEEMLILLKLQTKLYTRLVQSPQHMALLQRYWKAISSSRDPSACFSLVDPQWQLDGGCVSVNPGDDLRAMGQLGLECLVCFCENFSVESKMMKRTNGGYPFVKTCMALVRALCEVFALVDQESGQKGPFPVQRAMFWQILQSERSFFQLFCLCLLQFEQEFCQAVAKNPALVQSQPLVVSVVPGASSTQATSIRYCSLGVVSAIVDAGKTRLLQFLSQAPESLEDFRDFCDNSQQVLTKRSFEVPCAIEACSSKPAPTRWQLHQRSESRDKVKQILAEWEPHGPQDQHGGQQDQDPEQEREQEPAPCSYDQKERQQAPDANKSSNQDDLFQGLHVY